MEQFYTYLIGKKWKENGRGPDEFDCYGLVIEMMKHRGYYLPNQKTPDGIKMRMKMFKSISSEFAIPIDKIEPFCIVIFDCGRLARLHIGIVLANCKSFIHSVAHIKRVRVDSLSSWPWKNRITGYFKCTKKL